MLNNFAANALSVKIPAISLGITDIRLNMSRLNPPHRINVNQHQPLFVITLLFAAFILSLPGLAHANADTADIEKEYRAKIHIHGLNRSLSKDIKSELPLEKGRFRWRNQEDIRVALHDVAGFIELALQSRGYYSASIKKSAQSRSKHQWDFNYRISLNSPVLTTDILLNFSDTANADLNVAETLRDTLPTTPFQFDHRYYESLKLKLLTIARNQGHLDARFDSSRVEIDRVSQTATIAMILQLGQQYRFGNIQIQQSILNDELVERLTTIKAGEIYSNKRILHQQGVYASTDYFEEILIEPEHTTEQSVPLGIKLNTAKKNKYSVGAGYATDTGVRGSAGWQRRVLNSRGHKLNVDVSGSRIGGSLSIRYRIPIRNPAEDEIIFSSSTSAYDPSTSESSVTRTGVARSIKRNQWREILSLDFEGESYSVASDEDFSRLLIPSGSWTLKSPWHQASVEQGYRLNFSLRAADESLVSDTSFVQAEMEGKKIVKGSKRSRILARAHFGLTQASSISDLPASYRFFAGGDQSVRGYDYQALGPLDEEGEVTGGKFLATGSIEADYQLSDNWRIATFIDSGNSFNQINDYVLKTGTGVGLRYRTVIGTFHADFAYAIEEDSDPWRFHLWIGTDL